MGALECMFVLVICAEYVRRPASLPELIEHTLVAHDCLAVAALGHVVRAQAAASAAEHSPALVLHLRSWYLTCQPLRSRQFRVEVELVNLEAP